MEKLKIGLFGFGVVGQGIYQVLQRTRNCPAMIRRVCVSDVNKPRQTPLPEGVITDNADDILNDPEIELIVEVTNDAEAAFELVRRALERGLPVVSANKAMIATHLPELLEIQQRTGAALLYDASACGSIPVIRNLEEYYDNDLLLEVKGILNGSSNYILSRVFDHGEPYDDALRKAQELGFAEKDPTFDIEGFDSLFKLVIITVHALGRYVSPADIFTYGISTISDFDIAKAKRDRLKIKLVAQVMKVSATEMTMFVMPELVPPSRYIYSVDDEYNGVVIRGECYDRQFMFGKGAGSLPTASSILSDITARLHGYKYEYKKMHFEGVPQYTVDVPLRIYARYRHTPLPGLLPWTRIREQYTSDTDSYVVGDISLRSLIEARTILAAPDVFIANIPPEHFALLR